MKGKLVLALLAMSLTAAMSAPPGPSASAGGSASKPAAAVPPRSTASAPAKHVASKPAEERFNLQQRFQPGGYLVYISSELAETVRQSEGVNTNKLRQEAEASLQITRADADGNKVATLQYRRLKLWLTLGNAKAQTDSGQEQADDPWLAEIHKGLTGTRIAGVIAPDGQVTQASVNIVLPKDQRPDEAAAQILTVYKALLGKNALRNLLDSVSFLSDDVTAGDQWECNRKVRLPLTRAVGTLGIDFTARLRSPEKATDGATYARAAVSGRFEQKQERILAMQGLVLNVNRVNVFVQGVVRSRADNPLLCTTALTMFGSVMSTGEQAGVDVGAVRIGLNGKMTVRVEPEEGAQVQPAPLLLPVQPAKGPGQSLRLVSRLASQAATALTPTGTARPVAAGKKPSSLPVSALPADAAGGGGAEPE